MLGRRSGDATSRRRSSPRRATAPARNDEDRPRSQGSDIDITSMMEDMIRSSKQRRDARRAALKDAYRARVTEAREDMDSLFSEHEKNGLAARRIQLQRLIGLLEEKEEIERQMVVSTKALERAYLDRTRELKLILDARAAELR